MADAWGRRAFLVLAAVTAGAGLGAVRRASGRDEAAGVQATRPRRFVIDSHQHFDARPDYFEALVSTYRPRNAGACVLTPMAGFEATKKAAAAVQGAHFGNPWYEEAAETARWSPRLYFDVTGSSLAKKAKNLAVFKDYLWWEGPTQHSSPHAVYAFEKLVFGTDEAPEQLDANLARYEAMPDACAVPEASRRKIYGETIARNLGITVKA